MNDITKSFVERVAEKLIGQLKEGTAPWQKPWHAGEAGTSMPVNAVTGHRYQGINALQLMSEDREDQRWMTYKQATSVGAQVRKGEKGTPIQCWKFSEEQVQTDANDKPLLDAEGKPLKHTVRLERPALYTATVFNAEQIDGLPPAQRRKEHSWSAHDRAEAMLGAAGASIQHGERDRAFYRPSTDTIHLPNKEQFESADRYYATALHELGHWTGHPSRLDRDLAHPFGSEGYAREELRAEIASMIVGDELGIGHDPKQHAAYVGSWIKAIRDDPMEIFRAAADAEKIQHHLLGLERKQQQENTEAEKVASFIIENRGLPPERISENALGADAELRGFLADESKMKALDARVNALLQGVNRTYIDETRRTIASLLSGEDQGLAGVVEESTRAAFPAVSDADLDDAQMVADFIAANMSLEPKSVASNLSESPPALKSVLADGTRMKSIEIQVDQLLHNLTRAQIDETKAIVSSAFERDASPTARASNNTEADMEARKRRGGPADDSPYLRAYLDDPALQLTESEAAVASARAAGKGDEFVEASTRAFGVGLPANWTGHIRLDGDDIQGWSVHAQGADGAESALTTAMSETAARGLGRRLTLIDAHSEENEFEKAAKLARIREDVVREDPRSTEEDIAAAREARKDADLHATRNDADLLRRIAEQEQARFRAQAGPAVPGTPTYLNIAYEDREQAKALGAKWDRKEQAWYVPAGVDPAPLQKLVQPTHHPVTSGTQSQNVGAAGAEPASAGRTYLAVPYAERHAAKAAGAAWDKTAHAWYAGPNANMATLGRWAPDGLPVQQTPAIKPREEFADVLRAVGCVVGGEHPIMDGQKHRISVIGEKHRENTGSGFYVGHLDGHPAGYVKNNKTGVEARWKSKGYKLDQGQKALLRAQAVSKLQDRSADQARLQLQAAERVVQQMVDLVPISRPTPYMQSKGLEPMPGALTDRQEKTLYIPATDADGKHWTTQYIQSDGTKRFAKDSRKTGCFHAVGGLDALAKAPALVIAEGYATASSLANSLGHATVAAFDSGNLPVVAAALHQKFPDKPVVIAGDNDQHLETISGVNPGRSKAQEAAKLTNGRVLLPIFAPGEVAENPKGFTDFNDLANRSKLGKDGLDRQIRTVVATEIQKHHASIERLTQEQTLQQRHSLKIG
ncbi:zincin-like metallopeptidase domain-containing protein [Duganella sp. BuS-21]|uniref:zincin-like metallopeptidase domain-containing protein n=1 Tax=Duganella sp. BuS-21 TaxID=2943848 RepID=UPI0035A73944